MHLGVLPLELQLKVLQLCSRQDLSSLSRVHTSLQDIADYALYSCIYCTSFIEFRTLLETLTTNKQKASLVKVLDVKLIHTGVDKLRIQSLEVTAGMFSNMLNLHKLSISVTDEFRRSVGYSISRAIMFVFVQAISDGYFRLQILCLEECQCQSDDIKGIITSQPDLRLLGFLRRDRLSLLTLAQILHRDPSRRHPMPIIFILDGQELHRDDDRITLELAPSYHQPGEALEVFGEIEPYLNSSNRYSLKLDLFLISEKNINLLREVMKVAGIYLPDHFKHVGIVVRQLSIQNPWRFPEFVEPLTLFQSMEMLTFSFPYILGATAFHTLSTDMRSWSANSHLEILCPKLQKIEIWCIGGLKLILDRPHWHPEWEDES